MGRGITLAPCGLAIESIETQSDTLRIGATPIGTTATCPVCGTVSARIHSRYRRTLTDLPSQGRRVVLTVCARRFRCVHADCGQRIFAERLETTVGGPFARRTTRLDGIVHHLGLALGGRPGQSFARRLLLPVSNDTLLRVVRRRASNPEKNRAWSVSMILPGSAATATGRSSATWNGGASSIFCLIEKLRRRRHGWPIVHRSPSSRGIEAPVTGRPPRRDVLTPFRSLTGGT